MQTRYILLALGALSLFGLGCANTLASSPEAGLGDGRIPVSYKYPIAQEESICSAEPTRLAGREEKPIAQPYVRIRFLGQVFTEFQCRDGQEGFDPNQAYDLGSAIRLKAIASPQLYTALKDIGYLCAAGPESGCMTWRLESSVPMHMLMRLEPFVDEIQSDDCVNCG